MTETSTPRANAELSGVFVRAGLTAMSLCPDCGASYPDPRETCAQRFDMLLALDHSRRQPWGSRHGQAFAAFVLQHPQTYPLSLDAAWDTLYRIYCLGEPATSTLAARRARPAAPPCITRPTSSIAPFSVTIAHLGDFDAATYPALLDAWCQSALAGWGAPIP